MISEAELSFGHQVNSRFNSFSTLFSDDFEVATETVRRSARLVKKPLQLQEDGTEAKEVSSEDKPRRRKRERISELESSDADDDIQIISGEVAPIFLKRKWKEEFQVIKKAKQEFLYSGVPEVLKQRTAVQLELEQRPVEIFPKISHITQVAPNHKPLPYPEQLKSLLKPLDVKEIRRPTTFPSSLNSPSEAEPPVEKLTPPTSPLEWRLCKEWISGLKENHNSDFPFFRALRGLLSKSNAGEDFLWTDAFAPTDSLDILANRKPVQQLKQWLNQWKIRAGEQVISTPKKKNKKAVAKVGKRKRIDSNGPDFDDLVEDKSNSDWNSDRELAEDQVTKFPISLFRSKELAKMHESVFHISTAITSEHNELTVMSFGIMDTVVELRPTDRTVRLW